MDKTKTPFKDKRSEGEKAAQYRLDHAVVRGEPKEVLTALAQELKIEQAYSKLKKK